MFEIQRSINSNQVIRKMLGISTKSVILGSRVIDKKTKKSFTLTKPGKKPTVPSRPRFLQKSVLNNHKPIQDGLSFIHRIKKIGKYRYSSLSPGRNAEKTNETNLSSMVHSMCQNYETQKIERIIYCTTKPRQIVKKEAPKKRNQSQQTLIVIEDSPKIESYVNLEEILTSPVSTNRKQVYSKKAIVNLTGWDNENYLNV